MYFQNVLQLHLDGAAVLVSQEAQMSFYSTSQQSKVQILGTLQKVQFWLTPSDTCFRYLLHSALTVLLNACPRFN